MTEKLSSRLRGGWARTRRVSGDALASASNFVETHKHTIADSTHGALDGVGRVSESAGHGLVQRCQELRQELRDARPAKSGEGLHAFLDRAADGSLGLGGLIGRVLGSAGRSARKASPVIGAATGGAVAGTIGAVSGAVDAVSIQQSDFDGLQSRLVRADQEARRHSERELGRIEAARREGRRGELLDLLVIGGVSLSGFLDHTADVPKVVEEAFRLAYPGLAATGETFSDAVGRMPTDDLIGLVSGVKGKVFELELVEQFNEGGLADGLHAEIAASATQPGHDICILDSDGHTVDLLQAKATDSVAYVKEALERYPNIDVTTTSEVHGQLLALGLGEQVSDGGLTDAFLQGKVEAAAGLEAGLDATDFVPSAFGLALIAYSAFSNPEGAIGDRSEQFGVRAGKAGLSGAAGAALMLATGAWLLAPVGGIGFRVMVARGDAKRHRYEALKRIVESLEADNARQDGDATDFALS